MPSGPFNCTVHVGMPMVPHTTCTYTAASNSFHTVCQGYRKSACARPPSAVLYSSTCQHTGIGLSSRYVVFNVMPVPAQNRLITRQPRTLFTYTHTHTRAHSQPLYSGSQGQGPARKPTCRSTSSQTVAAWCTSSPTSASRSSSVMPFFLSARAWQQAQPAANQRREQVQTAGIACGAGSVGV